MSLDGAGGVGAQKVLRLLDALRLSPTGSAIYRQVEAMLEDAVRSRQTTETAYVGLIQQLLNAYCTHLREGSALQVEIRLLQARLQPPLSSLELAALAEYVDRYAGQIAALPDLDSELFEAAIEPVLRCFGVSGGPDAGEASHGASARTDSAVAGIPLHPQDTASERAAVVGDESEAQSQSAEAVNAVSSEQHPPEQEEVKQPETEPLLEGTVTGTPIRGEGAGSEIGTVSGEQVDSGYRTHLDSKRRDIQKLQETLAKQVLETIAQNEEFGVLLEVVLGELRQASDTHELEDLRWTLIREIETLTKGHHDLAEKLDSTHHYLQLIESDSRQLSDELTRVRLLSLTDELTALPNRRAFLRRIEDEVARVQRYGFPLSLALIDLDHFKQINDRHGHAGGDEVLKIYSKNILSIFRHHDLVARYGGEEFAVLLPNTDAEGSMRALNKVKIRAEEARWQANNESVPVPTFSAGVSLYKPGETASSFIERADRALYRAKRLGRNRVEQDETYDVSFKEAESAVRDSERKQRGES
jgi:diguanylate cyclase